MMTRSLPGQALPHIVNIVTIYSKNITHKHNKYFSWKEKKLNLTITPFSQDNNEFNNNECINNNQYEPLYLHDIHVGRTCWDNDVTTM